MRAKVRISENIYADREQKRIVNIETEEFKNLTGHTWMYLECCLENGAGLVTKEQLVRALWPKNPDANHKKYVHKKKNLLKNEFKNIGLSEADFDRIFSTRDGYGIDFHPKEPSISEEASDYILETGISADALNEMIHCMLFQGISGRMGRHTLLALANAGNPIAMFEMGELYYYGYITRNQQPDYESARAWYLKACEYKHPGAAWSLAFMIINNLCPRVPEDKIDYGKAMEYLDIALKSKGHASAAALTTRGSLMEQGKYPANDFAQTRRFEKADPHAAHEYYRKASEMGYHYATNRLAKMHEQRGEWEQAFDLYRKSVEQVSDGYAYNKLGLMCESGQGCAANVDAACEYYLKSVNEVLPNDITPYGLFNAARVYATLIPGQRASYLDLRKAFQLFFESMKNLETKQHGQMLSAMLDVFLTKNSELDALNRDEVVSLWLRTELAVREYLNACSDETIRTKYEAARTLYRVSL